MALRGRLSTAHEFDKNKECIYCGMYLNNVIALSHVCTSEREALADREALKLEQDTPKISTEERIEKVFDRLRGKKHGE